MRRHFAGKTIGVTTLNDMVQAAASRGSIIARRSHRRSGSNCGHRRWRRRWKSAHRRGRDRRTDVYLDQRSRQGDRVALRSVNNGKPFQTGGAIGNKLWVDQNGDLARRPHGRAAAHRGLGGKNPDEVSAMLAQMTKNGCRDRQLDPARHLRNENDLGLVPARDRRDRALWIHPEAVSRSPNCEHPEPKPRAPARS